jgi:hypothetical protein
MKVTILSHKRHDVVTTTKVVNDACLIVPKSQEELYKEHNPNVEIVTHSDDIIGISAKREWTKNKFGDVFMLDDDIKAMRRTYLPPKESREKLSPDEVTGILFDTYFMLKEQTDIKYFGFSKSPSPLHYNVTRPIMMNGFIQGCAMGIINDDRLHFPNIPTMIGEDEYMCLLNLHYNRKMWIDKRFFFEFKTNNYNIGGCEDIRNEESTLESYKHLKKSFGNSIVQDMKSSSLKWRTKINI